MVHGIGICCSTANRSPALLLTSWKVLRAVHVRFFGSSSPVHCIVNYFFYWLKFIFWTDWITHSLLVVGNRTPHYHSQSQPAKFQLFGNLCCLKNLMDSKWRSKRQQHQFDESIRFPFQKTYSFISYFVVVQLLPF